MVRIGERFFTSLGFAPLPQTFWERSLFRSRATARSSATPARGTSTTRATCASRCASSQTDEDFTTIHHELGHNFYQRAYNTLPFLFRDSANDGFHEAIGDTIALSVTPEYLVKIGLLDRAAGRRRGHRAAARQRARQDRVPAVRPARSTSGAGRSSPARSTPADYNSAWWELRCKYQGIAPPTARGEEFFDPGAKYHVPANMPYARYFLARILQFQFHRALCEDGRLHGAAPPLLDLRQQGSRAHASRRCWRWASRSPGPTRSKR